MLETKEPSEAWTPFDVDAIALTIIRYDGVADEFLPEVSDSGTRYLTWLVRCRCLTLAVRLCTSQERIHINGSKKLFELKEVIGTSAGIPASHLRLFQAISSVGSFTIREYFGAGTS